jgi:16S rRNA (guanine(966)-N(2))-methyltransferase RsmD
MIRLTGGERKGMALTAPRGLKTRPATARIRQWIFDVLGPPVDCDVLDLFAGTGAVGIEALSRGAASVLFVESAPRALRALEENLTRTRYTERAETWRADVVAACDRLRAQERSFDLCFCDPPYGWQGLERLLEQSVLDLLGPHGTLVVEHRGEGSLAPAGRVPDREERFGDTLISIWREA